jgi:dihydropteroate synthase
LDFQSNNPGSNPGGRILLRFLKTGVRLGTQIVGILNLTPDSFYPDSRAYGAKAVKKALAMHDEGAEIIDIGGESTRPGSNPITAKEELRRIAPIIGKLASRLDCKLSIDTYKPEVAKFAADAGAAIINDINGMRSKEMRELVSDRGLECVVMHMQGSPKTMQVAPHYRDVVKETKRFFVERMKLCERSGISSKNIIIDPGIGFGKTVENNLDILRNITVYRSFNKRIMVGVSRKGFIGKIGGTNGGTLPVEERLEGSLALACYCAMKGVEMLRVHDVKETTRALRLIDALK